MTGRGAVSGKAQPDPLTIAGAEMANGERLIWADSSSPAAARRRSLPIAVLGWLFLLLSLAWIWKAAVTSAWLLVMGLPFLALALALALLPWWWPAITRHTVYGISDRRLLIIRSWPKRRVTSYGPAEIDVVERRDHRDGSGDVIFRQEEHGKLRHHQDRSRKRRMSERPVGFYGVSEARRVEAAIWALKDKRHARAADLFQAELDHAERSNDGSPAAAPEVEASPKGDLS